MENNIKCPKCNNEMEEGLTHSPALQVSPMKWGEKDSVSKWTGNVKNGENITVYKCKSCGYLESYAN